MEETIRKRKRKRREDMSPANSCHTSCINYSNTLLLRLYSNKANNISNNRIFPPPPPPCRQSSTLTLIRVANDRAAEVPSDAASDGSEADKIVDGMDFGELCNDFECKSSPLVESTARQLVRDILELREDNRAFNTLAISVRYKDPLRSFTGRDKYKRRLWATDALENPTVSVQEMEMLSTSELSIKWTLKGKPKPLIFSVVGGDLILKVSSKFTLNQISGQVVDHEESWDLSASPSAVARAYFWASRGLFSAVESGKDVSESIKESADKMSAAENDGVESSNYADPMGDPTKFFQRGDDDGFQRDFYQIALFLAVVYFVVQFLRTTL